MDTTQPDDKTRETETERLRAVVAVLEHSQRERLPEEFIGLFREDAIWTTAHGRRLYGRDEIAAFTRKVLPNAVQEGTVFYEVEHVLFLRPDVAAVKARATYRGPDGARIGNQGSPMYVMTKEGGRWLLTANQNTEILDA
ncbi:MULTISPECIES: SgcJ/EcaC family oxidoreductase [unclassified Nocardiopsis]|uniref:SgcJ/EcaC family oxidoreductase n=1 Tax=Nocardiopsis TaxID=2013 RepID=UPI00387B0E35